MNGQNSSHIPVTVPCPQCDTPIEIPPTSKQAAVVECPACATESEIISVNPLQIAPLEEEK